jgi:hypothetical protein
VEIQFLSSKNFLRFSTKKLRSLPSHSMHHDTPRSHPLCCMPRANNTTCSPPLIFIGFPVRHVRAHVFGISGGCWFPSMFICAMIKSTVSLMGSRCCCCLFTGVSIFGRVIAWIPSRRSFHASCAIPLRHQNKSPRTPTHTYPMN